MHVQQIVSQHPAVNAIPNRALVHCIEVCLDCAQVCTSCADACLSEDMVDELRDCIRLNLDCADICKATAFALSRHAGSGTRLLTGLLRVCAMACADNGFECEQQAGRYEHCATSARVCERCEAACQEALLSLGMRGRSRRARLAEADRLADIRGQA